MTLKFLIDGSGKKLIAMRERFANLIAGQLLTPLTRYAYLGDKFAIDNGAFSGFDANGFWRILERQTEPRKDCLFVAAPDIVGSARRTLEVFEEWCPRLEGWPVALVAQDGQEDLPIPWEQIAAIFIGGTTDFKMSQAAADIVKAGIALGKHIHIGRVNTPARFKHFAALGADTCDGSGVSRYDWMLDRIAEQHFDDHPLLEGTDPPGAGRQEAG